MPGIEKMISITNVPVMMRPKSGAVAVTTGISELRKTWRVTTRFQRRPLARGRADVVLLHRLQHRAAHEPGEVRHREEAERERREDDLVVYLPEAERPSVRREEVESQREVVDEQGGDEEAG